MIASRPLDLSRLVPYKVPVLQELLRQRFNPALCGDLDATVEFNWSVGACRFGVHHAEVTFYEDLNKAPAPELVLYFEDEQQARAIIVGRLNPIEAFMAGEFRSNGYIVWAFQTLAAFSASNAQSS